MKKGILQIAHHFLKQWSRFKMWFICCLHPHSGSALTQFSTSLLILISILILGQRQFSLCMSWLSDKDVLRKWEPKLTSKINCPRLSHRTLPYFVINQKNFASSWALHRYTYNIKLFKLKHWTNIAFKGVQRSVFRK